MSSSDSDRDKVLERLGFGPASTQWRAKLIERLGYEPGQWNGRQHSADQLVGILRELEDGKDPYAGERNGTIDDWLSLDSASRSISRDERDGELRKLVDQGTWASAPGSTTRDSVLS